MPPHLNSGFGKRILTQPLVYHDRIDPTATCQTRYAEKLREGRSESSRLTTCKIKTNGYPTPDSKNLP